MPRISRREWLALSGALALVALWWLIWVPASALLFDEAYYWDWSRRLDLGYLDHPPLVAWLIRLTTLVGSSEFTVRIGMVLCGVGVVALAYWAGRTLGGPLAGWVCLLLAATCPLFGLVFSFAGPDAPLLLCWAGAVCAALQAVCGGSPRWWYVAGALCGLALLAKYVAVLLPLSLLLFLLLSPHGWLRRREPYLAGVVALLVCSPNLWWNLRHQWTSVHFQLSHGACVTAARSANYAVQAWLYGQNQVTLVGPLLAVALAAGTFAALREGLCERQDGPLLLACCTLVIAMVFFLAHGVRHWAAPGYFSAIVCAGVYLPGLLRRLRPGWERTLLMAAVGLVSVAGLAEWAGLQVAYAERAAAEDGSGWLIATAGRVDAALVRPVPRWRAAAGLVGHVLAGLPPGQRSTAVLVADGYGTAAELAFYLPGHPRVYSGSNQYALWPPREVQGPVLYVQDSALTADSPAPPAGGRLAASLTVRVDGATVGRYAVTVFSGHDAARVLPALLAQATAQPLRCQ